MREVFLWKVGDRIVHHTDKKAAAQIDGLSRTPDKTVTEEQFSAAGGLARIIDGKIILGRTEREISDESAIARIREIDARFDEIERRSIRPLLARAGNKEVKEDDEILLAFSAEAITLRAERKEKVNSLSTPLAQ